MLNDKVSYYVSADLTAFTDRFPQKLVSSVLKGRFPEEYVSHYENILVGYPFEIKIGKKISSLSYSVGNPMGAYSS